MLYRELLSVLNNCTDEQLNQCAIVYDYNTDEYIPADWDFTVGTDVIEDNHLVITIGS